MSHPSYEITPGEINRFTFEPRHDASSGGAKIYFQLRSSTVCFTTNEFNGCGTTTIKLAMPPKETLGKRILRAWIYINEDVLRHSCLGTLLIELPSELEELTSFVTEHCPKTPIIIRSHSLKHIGVLATTNAWFDTPPLSVSQAAICQGSINVGVGEGSVANPNKWEYPITSGDVTFTARFNPQDSPFPLLKYSDTLRVRHLANVGAPSIPITGFDDSQVLESYTRGKGKVGVIKTYRLTHERFDCNLTFPVLEKVEILEASANCNFPALREIGAYMVLNKSPCHFPVLNKKGVLMQWLYNRIDGLNVIKPGGHEFAWMFMVSGYDTPIFVEGAKCEDSGVLNIIVSIGCCRFSFDKLKEMAPDEIKEFVCRNFPDMSWSLWAKHKYRLVKIIEQTIQNHFHVLPPMPVVSTPTACCELSSTAVVGKS